MLAKAEGENLILIHYTKTTDLARNIISLKYFHFQLMLVALEFSQTETTV